MISSWVSLFEMTKWHVTIVDCFKGLRNRPNGDKFIVDLFAQLWDLFSKMKILFPLCLNVNSPLILWSQIFEQRLRFSLINFVFVIQYILITVCPLTSSLSPLHPYQPTPPVTTSSFPVFMTLVLFCDSFSLTRAIMVIIRLELPIGRVITGYTTEGNSWPSPWIYQQHWWTHQWGVGPSEFLLCPCLIVCGTVPVQTQCRKLQMLCVHDCNGCVLPRRWHFSALLLVFWLLHSLCPIFAMFPEPYRGWYKCLV